MQTVNNGLAAALVLGGVLGLAALPWPVLVVTSVLLLGARYGR